MPKGKGSSLGAALLDLFAQAGARKSSYRATGWQAQLREITASERGYNAADVAGLDVTHRTLLRWLSSPGGKDDPTPSKANQSKIHEAYELMARKELPDEIKDGSVKISGVVQYGDDVRTRGGGKYAALLVDMSNGDWDELEDRWSGGTLDAPMCEALWIEDVLDSDDALRSDYPWEFPGSSYSVLLV